jgi:O-acetyl-ADP-ribose deacetylase (regulator of RNase III)
MRLHLVDVQPDVVSAWREAFSVFPEVTIRQGDILGVAVNTIVSPANSHGFMDGGIDAQYTSMEMPEAVPAMHAYRALRAVLRSIGTDPIVGRDVYCPGLGTLTGRIPPAAAAAEMASAYRDWKAQTA